MRRIKTVMVWGSLLFLGNVLWFDPDLHAQADPFYQGKSIRIVVGFSAGSFYDVWARLIARYMPKYIPGNPDIVVQNMPGAGSVIAANYVYNVAKPDGLTLGAPSNGIYLDQIVGRKEVQFDVRKFVYLGSPVTEPILMYMRADAPYKSVADMRKAKEPAKCGSGGTADSGYVLFRLLEHTLPPLTIHTVTGYTGGPEIDLAVERGEVICRGFTASPFFSREPFLTWQKNKFVRVLLYTGRKRDPRIADAPTIFEVFEKEKVPEASRRVAEVILAREEFGRPIVGPPGTPADRLKILRAAFEKAMRDQELLAEAKKAMMDMDVVSGEALEKLADRIMSQPPEVIDQVRKLLK